MAVFSHGPDVVGEPVNQTRQTQNPEDDAEGKRHTTLEAGRLALEVEGEDDGHGDDAQVHGETEPGEEGALVGAVIASIGSGVFEQQGAEIGTTEEDVVLIFEMAVRC